MSGMMGFNIGVRALKAQQRALDVIAHNIANANTPGYSRQRAELVTTTPFTYPSIFSSAQAGQIGTGVEVEAITRIRDTFIDGRFRDENSLLGEWEQRANILHEIELIFGEPSESGLRSALSEFWSSIQNLSSDAGNGSIRSTVRQSGAAMADLLNSLHDQLKDYRRSVDSYIKNKVSEINGISQRIADLNKQISQIVGKDDNPNDLLDRRDLLIDQLSKIVDIETSYDSRGKANVTIGGFSLVVGDSIQELAVVEDYYNNGLVDIKWVSTNKEVKITGGEIAGLMEARDETIVKYMNELDTMAKTFINDFNEIHRQGYGLDNSHGIDFFTGIDASSIRVSDEIMDEVDGLNRIAAATAPDSRSDGDNAIKLSEVMKLGILSGDKVTMADYWGGIVSALGVETQRAFQMVENEENLIAQIDTQRQSVCGVQLDEEYANLIKFQQAYNAAAKVIKTQSEMLDTLVNGILT